MACNNILPYSYWVFNSADEGVQLQRRRCSIFAAEVFSFARRIHYDIEQLAEPPIWGMGGVAISAALTYQTYFAKSVKDLAGPGVYWGGSKGIGGFSVGVDAINTLGKNETMASTIREERSPEGYQLSIGAGIGYEPIHLGTSDTYIMLIFDEGKYIPLWKRKLVNSFAGKSEQ